MTNVSGINPPFEGLSRTPGQVIYALLTRAPLYSRSEDLFLVRLACVKHAASVRSEPGSNSPVQYPDQSLNSKKFKDWTSTNKNPNHYQKWNGQVCIGPPYYCSVFKDQSGTPSPSRPRSECRCGVRHSNSLCLQSQALFSRSRFSFFKHFFQAP